MNHRFAIPERALRVRVHGLDDESEEIFLEIGRTVTTDVVTGLRSVGVDARALHRILDFGCGPGRMLRWLVNETPATLYGSDIDPEAIAWCREYLPFASCEVNGELPPLPYADGHFDLVVAIAVFQHFAEDQHLLWLDEMHRIVRQGGWVMVSVVRSPTGAQPVLTHVTEEARDQLPWTYWYSEHTREYLEPRYRHRFQLVRWIDKGINNDQDLVILRR
jgi:ubiquinone/menaquinone biosynthesis C-methylase UbiE